MSAHPGTYPGTVSPLRQGRPHAEADRDVLFGRDGEIEALARLVTQDGVRAVLLVGEPGVGKTSLLRAGLVPYLRDHGVMVLPLSLDTPPADTLARMFAEQTRMPARDGERPLDYITRVVGQVSQLSVIVIDDVDLALAGDEGGRLTAELGEVFQRVTARSSGRARFLFAATDSRLHQLDALERRTGSLFPPQMRQRLPRLATREAQQVIERIAPLALIASEPSLAPALAHGLSQGGGVRPIDLQLVLSAVKVLGIGSAQALAEAGGTDGVVARWLRQLAVQVGPERQVLRVLGVLGEAQGPRSAAEVARVADVAPQVAEAALVGLTQPARALVVAHVGDDGVARFAPALPAFAQRFVLLGAAARAQAADARLELERAAAAHAVLSPSAVARVTDAQIEARSPAETTALVGVRKRRWPWIAGALAVPVGLILSVYALQAGKGYTSSAGEGSARRLVLRAGRPGLSGFTWLPHTPRFGQVAADLGVSSALARPGVLAEAPRVLGLAEAGDKGRGATADVFLAALEPRRARALAHALGEDGALAGADALMKTSADIVALMGLLEPVAHGGDAEEKLVAIAIADPSPAAQEAALAVALSAATRHEGAYTDLLAQVLVGADGELRAAARAGVLRVPAAWRQPLLGAALGRARDDDARLELVDAILATGAPTPATGAQLGLALLAAPGPRTPGALARGWAILDSAAKDPAATTPAYAQLAASDDAQPAVRVRALAQLVDLDAKALAPHAAALGKAAAAGDASVAAAALPLYARAAPDEAAKLLAGPLPEAAPLRAARALAWGELAAARPAEAQPALDALLADRSGAVRAAAARAYGHLGELAVEPLVKLAKQAGGELAEGAGWGLAAAVRAGASPSSAAAGIGQLWKRKGGAKRAAARIYADLCAVKPNAFVGYAASAARDRDDAALGPIGVDGLCRVVQAGAAKQALSGLRTALDSEDLATRLAVAACVAAEAPALGDAGVKLVVGLAKGAPAERVATARALGALAAGDKPAKGAAAALVGLLGDEARDVRVAAAEGLAGSGDGSVGEAGKKALAAAWARGDAGERAALVAAAGRLGAGEVIEQAARDTDPAVRVAAVGVLHLVAHPAAALGAAIADGDPRVRGAALARLGEPGLKLDVSELGRALERAIYGRDPLAAETALAALTAAGDATVALAILAPQLAAEDAGARARAYRALGALAQAATADVTTHAKVGLGDPSREVRMAATAAAARAAAVSVADAELVKRLAGAEGDAQDRLVAAIALWHKGSAAPDAAKALLAGLESAPPLARLYGKLVAALVAGGADGEAFLLAFVP